MTNIQKHVTSLELSKKLKELGFKQESYFSWIRRERERKYSVWNPTEESEFSIGDEVDKIPAYLASELWELLPEFLAESDGYYSRWHVTWSLLPDAELRMVNNIMGHSLEYFTDDDKSVANVIARAMIYLMENGYWEPELISSKDKDNE